MIPNLLTLTPPQGIFLSRHSNRYFKIGLQPRRTTDEWWLQFTLYIPNSWFMKSLVFDCDPGANSYFIPQIWNPTISLGIGPNILDMLEKSPCWESVVRGLDYVSAPYQRYSDKWNKNCILIKTRGCNRVAVVDLLTSQMWSFIASTVYIIRTISS